MSVVLPAPSGPTKAVSVPCSTPSDTPSSACTISPPSRRKVFLISRPLKTFVCSARFIVSPLDVDKETRRSGDKETWRHRKYETAAGMNIELQIQATPVFRQLHFLRRKVWR